MRQTWPETGPNDAGAPRSSGASIGSLSLWERISPILARALLFLGAMTASHGKSLAYGSWREEDHLGSRGLDRYGPYSGRSETPTVSGTKVPDPSLSWGAVPKNRRNES